MTIAASDNRKEYAGNGVTTVFTYNFPFFANSDLRVLKRNTTTGAETPQTITTHYTVSGAGGGTSGQVTMLSAPAAGETLVIYAEPAIAQEFDPADFRSMSADELEKAIDRAVVIARALKDFRDRCFRTSDGQPDSFDPRLPAFVAADGGKCLVLKSDASGVELGPTTSTIEAAAQAATDAEASALAAANSAASASTDAATATTKAGEAASEASAAATAAAAAAADAQDADSHRIAAAASAAAAADSETNAAASAAAAAAALEIREVTGSEGAPELVTAAGGIVPACSVDNTIRNETIYIKGNGGPITITANPQIADGTVTGQRVTVFGTDDTDTVTVANGNGVMQNGDQVFDSVTGAEYEWTGVRWREVGRL